MGYIANTPKQQKQMLDACGVESIADLFSDIPASLAPKSFNLPKAKSELEVRKHLADLAGRNFGHLTNFLGGGFYDHYIPAAVDALAGRSEFYTAYTPYQPEISQGTLQAIYEYQSHICRLTGLDASNASLYDGGTALFEACQMARTITDRSGIVLDGGVNPIYRKMVYSYAANLSMQFAEVEVSHGQTNRKDLCAAINSGCGAVVLQNPNFFGVIDDHSDIVAYCKERGIITIQVINPLALAILKTPGEMGFDIAVGEGQPLGIPLSFGGPYLGIIAVRKEHVRKMPGRIVGRTVDAQGRDGFVLTLQAREQHIRREKATSNICSNEALCALRAHIYMSVMGAEGLVQVATLCTDKAAFMKQRLATVKGVRVLTSSPTCYEFTIELPKDAKEVVGAMIERGFAAGFPLGRYYPGMDNYLLIAVTEKRTRYEISHYVETLEDVLWG